ncbi:MAG: hypothetical protein WA697_11950, partial [Pseudolabrys sp.]
IIDEGRCRVAGFVCFSGYMFAKRLYGKRTVACTGWQAFDPLLRLAKISWTSDNLCSRREACR